VWRDTNNKWNGQHRYSTTKALPNLANPPRWTVTGTPTSPNAQGNYEIVFNRPIAAVSTAAGDMSLEDRAQSWMYAIYQGETLSENPNFARHNAGTGVFTYNALAADSVSNGAAGIENSRGKSLLIHAVSMSLAWTVFSYFG
jgi:hypothetical protein